MSAPTVLVAFSSQSGSTAGIAEVIAAELRGAGIAVDSRVASDVTAIGTYDGIVLGSGVFVRSRATDGGGFVARNRASLAGKPVWLYCAGPIGRGGSADATPAAEGAVMDVARSIGARGAAAFGCADLDLTDDGHERMPGVDIAPIREWARGIAAVLVVGRGSLAAAS